MSKDKSKDKQKAVNHWMTGHPDDDFIRSRLLAYFRTQPITVMGLIQFMLFEVDEAKYRSLAPAIIHDALGTALAQAVAGMALALEDQRSSPTFAGYCVALTAGVDLLARQFIVPQAAMGQAVDPMLMERWVNSAITDDKAKAAILRILPLTLNQKNIEPLAQLYISKPEAPAPTSPEVPAEAADTATKVEE